MVSKQLVVLVGGRGTRLGEATKATPKPLMDVKDGKVFLDYFLENCVRQGFDDILFLAGYLGEQVRDRYDGKQMGAAHMRVLIEPEPMGTGGALKFAYDHLAPTFICANGDTLFDINIRAVDQAMLADPALAGAIALRRVEDPSRYGQVRLGDDGRIVAFEEKKSAATPEPGLINGGIYALRKSAIDRLPAGVSSIENDLFPQLVADRALAGVESSGYFLDIGLPETLQTARDVLPYRKRPALFLDRDGVINVEKNYLYRVEDFEWIDGIQALIRKANDLGHAVIVVTNQAGVARGFYTEADVHVLHDHIQQSLYEAGAFVDGFYYCPYHPEGTVEAYCVANHPDRKPNPGMILRAATEHNLDMTQAVLIGDQPTDVAAATAAGIRGLLFAGGSLTDLPVGF